MQDMHVQPGDMPLGAWNKGKPCNMFLALPSMQQHHASLTDSLRPQRALSRHSKDLHSHQHMAYLGWVWHFSELALQLHMQSSGGPDNKSMYLHVRFKTCKAGAYA